MVEFAELVLKYIMAGGPGAIITMMGAIIGVMGWHIFRQDKLISKKDDRNDEVIDQTFASNKAIADSLDHLRVMIFELVRAR